MSMRFLCLTELFAGDGILTICLEYLGPRHSTVGEPYLGLILSNRRVREYEKREKFEDFDMKADAELGTFKIRRYHFDDESFVHPHHSVRFDPDRPYKIPTEALMADKILSASKDEKSSTERPRSSRRPTPHYSPRTMPVAQRERSTSSVKGTCNTPSLRNASP
ncbi:hypothetical protein PIB30_037138 [Stylosanthes scabra]|uniref:Uncharacterized protein n=1 Tax=Stylosanthes scabra TaxID=79078 RepID=A0ABU6QDR0_9FABA|nr:hypothetical protein [Stylosanthes scabra]